MVEHFTESQIREIARRLQGGDGEKAQDELPWHWVAALEFVKKFSSEINARDLTCAEAIALLEILIKGVYF